MSALRNNPYRKCAPLTVKNSAPKLGLPPIAARKGVMKLAVNEVTSAPKAAPISTATARSTTLPRRRNFRKPLMARTSHRRLLDASWRGSDDWSDDRPQHSGIEDARGVQRGLRREQRP